MNAVQDDIFGGKKEKTVYIIRKVVQALIILEQFSDEVDELSLGELSRRLDLHEGTTAVLVDILKQRSYLEQNATNGYYRLGFKNLELAQTVLRQTDLYRVSHPVLASLVEECQENCAVAVLRKAHVIELDAVLAEHPVRVVSRVGVHLPVHCTSSGKLLVAMQRSELREALLKEISLAAFTDKTATDADQVRSEWSRVVECGYAIDDEELDRDVRSVAAPIRDFGGRVVGAVVITGPSCRISVDRLTSELLPLALSGAAEISAKLGYNSEQRPGTSETLQEKVLRSSPRKRRPTDAASAL